jgi:glycosyltransferase involved in cell wall biosynthesis
MNILFLCKTFPRGESEAIVSGEVKNAYLLAKSLSERGHSITVWASGDTDEGFDLGAMKVRRNRVSRLKGAFKTIAENLADLGRAGLLGQERFDIVLNHRLTAPVLLPRRLRKRCGAVYVNTAHGTNWPEINANRYRNLRGMATFLNGLVQLQLDRASYRVSDMVVSVSKFQEKELAEIYHIPQTRIETIRNGVNLDHYRAERPPRPTDGTKRVLFVGRMVKKKGLDLILEGAAELRRRRSDIRYDFVVGSPEYAKIKPHFEGKIVALGLGDICTIHWSVPETDLPGFYQRADVFVAPSEGYESLPTVLLEALSCGTPVLTTAAWGTREVGLAPEMLLNTRELPEYCAKLDHLLNTTYPEEGLRAIVAGIDWTTQAAHYEQLFQKVIAHAK